MAQVLHALRDLLTNTTHVASMAFTCLNSTTLHMWCYAAHRHFETNDTFVRARTAILYGR